MKKNLQSLSYFLSAFILSFYSAASASSDIDNLMSMDLDELTSQNVTVTTAAKKEQPLNDVPAAIYVITNEQIRRSGVRSIAEALALAPGVQVTKLSEFNWQVSLRGLNETLFNKLLVMVDGRSVFSPLMSGTFWHTIDTILDDIDRIEILRGSAGTMWGGNATNGVINIITKNSNETLGQFFEIAHGQYNYKEADYRYGFQLNDFTTARLSVKGVQSDYYSFNDDEWNNYNVAFRTDYIEDDQFLTFQLGGYHTKSEHSSWYTYDFLDQPLHPLYPDTAIVANPSLLKDYSRGVYSSLNFGKTLDDTQYKGSFWIDNNSRTEPTANGQYSTVNGDLLMIKQLNEQNELTMGIGARYTRLKIPTAKANYYIGMQPYQRLAYERVQREQIYNVFSQLETQLTDKLTSSLGVKVEHFTRNDTTELQPQLRLHYKVTDDHQLWTGIGRAVVTPSAVDSTTDMFVLGNAIASIPNCDLSQHPSCVGMYPAMNYTAGNKDMDNESVVTWDAGYRGKITDTFSLDATVFYSEYDNLRMIDDGRWICTYGYCEDGTTLPGGTAIFRNSYSDNLTAQSYGAELALFWQPTEAINFNTSYSFIDTQSECDSRYRTCDTYLNGGYKALYDHQPNHYGSIQMMWTLNPQWQIDWWLKHKGSVSSSLEYYEAPAITTLDLRVAWQQKHSWPLVELVVDGLGSSTYEDMPNKAPLEETVFMRLSWTTL
ncbi:TonB-dependent receptor plug domain-containing protein [Photobacterium leiognathi]|uniref:TonB-dependent receptor plug domain-containing protein n=1 Tax=Photobacterium leiognathi TaxID=553611 RepID=UPI002980C742|nr:TonB-dependent receptor [Photobacterium leiognathi]